MPRRLPDMPRIETGQVIVASPTYLGKPGRLPARVRALLDYLAAELADNSRTAP